MVFNIVGTEPLLYNAMNQKAKRELLSPRGRLTAADKQVLAKHNPLEEFRNSVYRRRDDETGPTRLIFPAPAFKKCLAQAALDMPGSATKAQLGRLTYVPSVSVDIFGVPELHMGIVRMADIKKTPDVRTRAILPRWCAQVTIMYAEPMLNATTVANLFAAAGMICGIGDGRQEKGSLSFGLFELREDDDEEFLEIMENGGIVAQDEALNAEFPHCFDHETEELAAWWMAEQKRKGRGDDDPRGGGRKKPAADLADAAE